MDSSQPPQRRILANVLRWAVATLLIGYMLSVALSDASLAEIRRARLVPGLIGLAALLCLFANTCSALRWMILLKAIHVPVRFRLCVFATWIAECLQFVAFGSVGGDVFRLVTVGRRFPEQRPAVFASLVLDRIVGLYSLILLAAVGATLMSHRSQAALPQPDLIQGTLWSIVIAAPIAAVAAFSLPMSIVDAVLKRIPVGAATLRETVQALRQYRSRPVHLLLSIALGLVIHTLLATTVWLVACGVSLPNPGWASHLMIVPLATTTGILPLPMAGLGAYELVIDFLYRQLTPGSTVVAGTGVLVAFAYRLVILAVAAVTGGGAILFSGRAQTVKGQVSHVATPN